MNEQKLCGCCGNCQRHCICDDACFDEDKFFVRQGSCHLCRAKLLKSAYAATVSRRKKIVHEQSADDQTMGGHMPGVWNEDILEAQ